MLFTLTYGYYWLDCYVFWIQNIPESMFATIIKYSGNYIYIFTVNEIYMIVQFSWFAYQFLSPVGATNAQYGILFL